MSNQRHLPLGVIEFDAGREGPLIRRPDPLDSAHGRVQSEPSTYLVRLDQPPDLARTSLPVRFLVPKRRGRASPRAVRRATRI